MSEHVYVRACGRGRGHGHLCACGGGCAHGDVRACVRACAWPYACARGSDRACAGVRACAGWCACGGGCGACVCDGDAGAGAGPATQSDHLVIDMFRGKAYFLHPSQDFLPFRERLRICPRREQSWMTSH